MTAFILIISFMAIAQRTNIKDANGYLLGYTKVNYYDASKVNVFDRDGNLIATIEHDNNYINNARNYFPELRYSDDPIAKEIKPDYNKLSNSAWGIEEGSGENNFNPQIEENIDPNSSQFDKYVSEFNELVGIVKRFKRIGIDITLPSSDPDQNAAHQEWQQRWNANFKLGKKIKMK